MGDEFDVDPAALGDAASRITDAVADMAGSKLGDLAGSAGDFGHADLQQALTDFCSGLELSSQILAQTSESASDALKETARSYIERDLEARAAVQKAVGEVPPQTRSMAGDR